MNGHPFSPPENYDYEKIATRSGEVVVAKDEEGFIRGAANFSRFNIPLIPEIWNQAIDDVRLRRAEVKAADMAESVKEKLIWLSPLKRI